MCNNQNLEELLPIRNYKGKRAINARDLHAFLGSKQQFQDWIKARIKSCYAEENVDYQVFYFDYKGDEIPLHKIMKSENQYVSKIEYAISISIAKEFSMIEHNMQGKIARKYFIHCEEILNKEGEFTPSIAGVSPIQYEGKVLYNYCEMCAATGVKPNSGRKKRMPSGFCMLWGRSFVTLEYARLMEGRANLRKLEAEAKAKQLPLFPDDDTEI